MGGSVFRCFRLHRSALNRTPTPSLPRLEGEGQKPGSPYLRPAVLRVAGTIYLRLLPAFAAAGFAFAVLSPSTAGLMSLSPRVAS